MDGVVTGPTPRNAVGACQPVRHDGDRHGLPRLQANVSLKETVSSEHERCLGLLKGRSKRGIPPLRFIPRSSDGTRDPELRDTSCVPSLDRQLLATKIVRADLHRVGKRLRIDLDLHLRGQVVPLREDEVLSKQLQHHALLAVKITHEAERAGPLGLIHQYFGR